MEVNKKRWLCGGTAAALALALAVAGIVCWFRTNRVPPPKTSIRIGVVPGRRHLYQHGPGGPGGAGQGL